MWPKIDSFKPVMVVLVTCKNEEDPFKNEGAIWSQEISHYKSIRIFPDLQGQITPQSEFGAA